MKDRAYLPRFGFTEVDIETARTEQHRLEIIGTADANKAEESGGIDAQRRPVLHRQQRRHMGAGGMTGDQDLFYLAASDLVVKGPPQRTDQLVQHLRQAQLWQLAEFRHHEVDVRSPHQRSQKSAIRFRLPAPGAAMDMKMGMTRPTRRRIEIDQLIGFRTIAKLPITGKSGPHRLRAGRPAPEDLFGIFGPVALRISQIQLGLGIAGINMLCGDRLHNQASFLKLQRCKQAELGRSRARNPLQKRPMVITFGNVAEPSRTERLSRHRPFRQRQRRLAGAWNDPACVSRSLRRLEDQLGTVLFTRHSAGMDLTPFGVTLRRHAELVEFESNRVVEEIRMLNEATTGFVRVGLVPSVVGGLFRSALPKANELSPQI